MRRGWIRIVLGATLIAAGIAAVVLGIVGAVGERGRIEADAVARGHVDGEGLTGPVAFTVPPGDPREYTVYLIFPGRVSREPQQSLAVRDTGCTAALPGGAEDSFRGARQGTSTSIGQASSIGGFSSAPGRVTVRCGYTSSTRQSRRLRPDRLTYVVTPGGSSGAAALLIVAGTFAAVGGGFLIGWGWRRRQPL